MNFDTIFAWLHESDPDTLKQLWMDADLVRKENVGDAVHLRGLIELSNYCCRSCTYCGISANMPLSSVAHYRMTADDIMECVHKAVQFQYGTVVLQSGEDYGITTDFISDLIRKIKKETDLAITLSLGERTKEEFVTWKKDGADRYLLRFETSDKSLYQIIHPPLKNQPENRDRITILEELKTIGYETGSGIMVGIPGQSFSILAHDIMLFKKLDLDMIGIGPYLPHPQTALGRNLISIPPLPEDEKVPNTELMVYKAVALARINCPKANIPSTTALATLNKKFGREYGLQRGANVVMPNLTPLQYRNKYTIYPDKACINETADVCHSCMRTRIELLGRVIGSGKGSARKN